MSERREGSGTRAGRVRRNAMRAGLLALTSLGALLAAVCRPASAQDAQDPVELADAGSVAERVSGAYRLDDGDLLVVWDVVDQMPEGRHQLVTMEPASGRVRTLYPTSDSTFFTGPGWFVREPRELRLTFAGLEDGAALHVRILGGRRDVSGRRIRTRSREVTVDAGDARLAGSLILPPVDVGRAPYPSLVMGAGSGRLTRRTPRYVAEQLAARGVAVLVTDKRGTGASGGRLPAEADVLAADLVAALRHLRGRPEVDPERTGVMLSSFAGYYLPTLVESGVPFSFLVCRVCAVTPYLEVRLGLQADRLRRDGQSAASVAEALAYSATEVSFALNGRGYGALSILADSTAGASWRALLGVSPEAPGRPADDREYWASMARFFRIDPGEAYARLEVPVYAVFGEYDRNMPGAQQAAVLRRILQRSGHPDHEVRLLPRASHGLMVTTFDADGTRRPHRRFVPGWHDRMVEWVLDHTRPGGGRGH